MTDGQAASSTTTNRASSGDSVSIKGSLHNVNVTSHANTSGTKSKRAKVVKHVLWYIAIAGVFGACVAGTVLSHGVAAPVFAVMPTVVEMARTDLKRV